MHFGGAWVFSLSIILRSVHVVSGIKSSFLLLIVWIYFSLFILSICKWTFGLFHFSAITNKAGNVKSSSKIVCD